MVTLREATPGVSTYLLPMLRARAYSWRSRTLHCRLEGVCMCACACACPYACDFACLLVLPHCSAWGCRRAAAASHPSYSPAMPLTRSACTSASLEPSYVLRAIGMCVGCTICISSTGVGSTVQSFFHARSDHANVPIAQVLPKT